MRIFLRETKFTLLNLSRDKSFLFWTFMYPIIMAVFFYLAFGKLLTEPDFTINVGIAEESQVKGILKEIDILKVRELTPEAGKEAMKAGEISVYVDENSDIQVMQSGMAQTTVKNILDTIKQMFYFFENGKMNGEVDYSKSYVKVKEQSVSPMSIIFYSLVAMVAFYGYFGGVEVMNNFQANNSELGKRMSISPIRKGRYVLSSVIVSFSLNMFSNLLLIFFINYGLKINLFVDYSQSLFLVLLGNLWGISFGVLIGSLSSLSAQVKNAIGIGLPLFFSFLSGMMGVGIKAMIVKYLPIAEKINPVSIITNGLYRINLLSRPEIYWEGILVLIAMPILFLLLSVAALRRKQYDSL